MLAAIIVSAGILGFYAYDADARAMANQEGLDDCHEVCIEFVNNGDAETNECAKWVTQCFSIDGTSYLAQ